MNTEREQIQELFAKIQNQPIVIDKLDIIRGYSKQIEVILEIIKPKTSRATQVLIDTFNNLLEANYQTLLEGGLGNCKECLTEAQLIFDRITFPLS